MHQYQNAVSSPPTEVVAATPEDLSLCVEEGKDGRPLVRSMPYVKGRLEKEGVIQPGMVREPPPLSTTNCFFSVEMEIRRHYRKTHACWGVSGGNRSALWFSIFAMKIPSLHCMKYPFRESIEYILLI